MGARAPLVLELDQATSMKSPKRDSEPAAAAEAKSNDVDVALVHAVGADGSVHVIRRRGDTLEAGALQPVREGAPIHGELVSLKPRPNCPVLCDVQVHYAPPAAAKPAARVQRRKGPAQVATDNYRDNWDSIWSHKKSSALN
jgi:hypothetical protein